MWWVLGAVAVGLLVPDLEVLEPLVLPALFVMVGSISLTLDGHALLRAPKGVLAAVVAAGVLLPVAAYGLGSLAGLAPVALAGVVVWAASPPELTTPVLTRLGGGDTALSAATLVLAGTLSVAVAPAALLLLPDTAAAVAPLVRSLLLAVVLPMGLAVAARTRWPTRLAPSDRHTPAVSAAMVVLVLAIVAAVSARSLRADPAPALAAAGVGVAVLVLGVGAGWALGRGTAARRSAALSLGIRDFAVAAALLLAAGMPPEAAAVPAAIGLVEMVAGASLAWWWTRRAMPASQA